MDFYMDMDRIKVLQLSINASYMEGIEEVLDAITDEALYEYHQMNSSDQSYFDTYIISMLNDYILAQAEAGCVYIDYETSMCLSGIEDVCIEGISIIPKYNFSFVDLTGKTEKEGNQDEIYLSK